MTHQEFVKLQNCQLEITDEIHRICTKNGISYYMVGETGIGAVRHRGFIRWDVDVDISILLREYDKLLEVCKTDLNNK